MDAKLLGERQLEKLAEARAARPPGRSPARDMSSVSRKGFYREFFSHVALLETRPGAFLTLTHGRDASKSLFHRWQQVIRNGGIKVAGYWVAELQRPRRDIEARVAGAVHYHLALGYDGDAAAEWLRITGNEGSAEQWRGRYATDLRMIGWRRVDRVRIARYLQKVADVACLGRELAKSQQKVQAYGRTWGRVNTRLVARFRADPGELQVDPVAYVSRAIAVQRVLHEVARPELRAIPVPGQDVVPLRLWSVGDEADFMATGNFMALLRLFHLRPRGTRARLAAKIYAECRERRPGWSTVHEPSGQAVDLALAL